MSPQHFHSHRRQRLYPPWRKQCSKYTQHSIYDPRFRRPNHSSPILKLDTVPDRMFRCFFNERCFIRSPGCHWEYSGNIYRYRDCNLLCDGCLWKRDFVDSQPLCSFDVGVSCGVGFSSYLLYRCTFGRLADGFGCVLVKLCVVCWDDL